MRGVIVAALAPLMLAGCVTNQVRWDRPGATADQFAMEKAGCEYEARLGTPNSYYGRGLGNALAAGISDGMRVVELQTLCMQAKGWQRTVVAEAPAPTVIIAPEAERTVAETTGQGGR